MTEGSYLKKKKKPRRIHNRHSSQIGHFGECPPEAAYGMSFVSHFISKRMVFIEHQKFSIHMLNVHGGRIERDGPHSESQTKRSVAQLFLVIRYLRRSNPFAMFCPDELPRFFFK